jgi:hypothetical protein
MSLKMMTHVSELTNLGVSPSTIRTSYHGDDLPEATIISDFEHSLRLEENGPFDERPQSSYSLLSLCSQQLLTGLMYYRQDDDRHSP